MNGRLGIISGAAFAGVVAAAILINGLPGFATGGDPGSAGAAVAAAETSSAQPQADTPSAATTAVTVSEASFAPAASDGSRQSGEHDSRGGSHERSDHEEDDD